MPVRGGGFIQGYNAQNMTSGDGLIIATELTDDPADMAVRADAGQAEEAAALIEAHRPAAAPARTPGGRPAAASGWRWPMPATARRPT